MYSYKKYTFGKVCFRLKQTLNIMMPFILDRGKTHLAFSFEDKTKGESFKKLNIPKDKK